MPSVCTASICSGLKYNERVNATLFYMQLLKLFTGRRKNNGQKKMFPGAPILFSGLVQDVTMNILVHTKSFDFFVKLGVRKKVKLAPLMPRCVHNVAGLARLNMLLSVQDHWIQHEPASITWKLRRLITQNVHLYAISVMTNKPH